MKFIVVFFRFSKILTERTQLFPTKTMKRQLIGTPRRRDNRLLLSKRSGNGTRSSRTQRPGWSEGPIVWGTCDGVGFRALPLVPGYFLDNIRSRRPERRKRRETPPDDPHLAGSYSPGGRSSVSRGSRTAVCRPIQPRRPSNFRPAGITRRTAAPPDLPTNR